jgi:hypothetical protein
MLCFGGVRFEQKRHYRLDDLIAADDVDNLHCNLFWRQRGGIGVDASGCRSQRAAAVRAGKVESSR